MQTLKIGKLELPLPVILAPMSGVTDLPFRMVARRFGCSLAFLEMISARAFVYGSSKNPRMIALDPSDRPLAAQLLGNDPALLEEAALRLESLGISFLDLNAACPVKKVVTKGMGAALLQNPSLLQNILRHLVRTVKIPVTVKIRSGWDRHSLNASDVARMCQDLGVKAIFLHGRHREQKYASKVCYEVIRKTKEVLKIPLVASGDIWSGESAIRMFEMTNCNGITVARGAIGNPWIFREIACALEGRGNFEPPTIAERKKTLLEHSKLAAEIYGEERAMRKMRKLARKYLKGISQISNIANSLDRFRTVDGLERILKQVQVT